MLIGVDLVGKRLWSELLLGRRHDEVRLDRHNFGYPICGGEFLGLRRLRGGFLRCLSRDLLDGFRGLLLGICLLGGVGVAGWCRLSGCLGGLGRLIGCGLVSDLGRRGGSGLGRDLMHRDLLLEMSRGGWYLDRCLLFQRCGVCEGGY
jgi:hypothetical protein